MHKPIVSELKAALVAAGSAHHEYQKNALSGQRDEQWAAWYAAYLLGRLGDFETPTKLAVLLQEAQGDGEWAAMAAGYVCDKLN